MSSYTAARIQPNLPETPSNTPLGETGVAFELVQRTQETTDPILAPSPSIPSRPSTDQKNSVSFGSLWSDFKKNATELGNSASAFIQDNPGTVLTAALLIVGGARLALMAKKTGPRLLAAGALGLLACGTQTLPDKNYCPELAPFELSKIGLITCCLDVTQGAVCPIGHYPRTFFGIRVMHNPKSPFSLANYEVFLSPPDTQGNCSESLPDTPDPNKFGKIDINNPPRPNNSQINLIFDKSADLANANDATCVYVRVKSAQGPCENMKILTIKDDASQHAIGCGP